MPKQRSDGEGGVWQEKTGKHAGRWRGAISITDAAGNRRRREVYGKTRAEVVKKVKALQQQQTQGVNLTLKRPTVAAFLQHWLDQSIAPNRKPRTLESYQDTIRLYIAPHLGGVSLDELTTARIQAWVNMLQQDYTAHIALRPCGTLQSVQQGGALGLPRSQCGVLCRPSTRTTTADHAAHA
jgi:hypothetical protein